MQRSGSPTARTGHRNIGSSEPLEFQDFSLINGDFMSDVPVPGPIAPRRCAELQIGNVTDGATQINSFSAPVAVPPQHLDRCDGRGIRVRRSIGHGGPPGSHTADYKRAYPT
jgi:hypothetical protein